jgi:hypothetical protein
LSVVPARAQSAAEPADDAEIPAAADDAAPPATAPDGAAKSGEEKSPAPAPASPALTPPPKPAEASAPAISSPAPATTAAPAAAPAAATPLVDIAGYVQGEYQSHADSEEQLRQGGGLLNQDRFLVRRARLVLKRAWEFSSLEVELDENSTSGPAFGLYRAEASLFYRGPNEASKPPVLQLTVGAFKLPFGFELPESSSQRWFAERTQLSRALWPSEIDVGARLSGSLSAFRYALAVTNGEPLGEKSGFQLQDPNANKDVTLNVGVKASPVEGFEISGGVSALTGKGFHAGTGLTKAVVGWRDINENGLIDSGELVGAAAQAETPSKNFERFAIGADLELTLKTALGASMLYGEFIAAKNLDRGFFVADPIAAPQVDLRELGFYVGFLQNITQYAVVGVRGEYYDPNADSSEPRAGRVVPLKNTVKVVSPIAGLTLPNRARLLFQYDFIRDHLGRNSAGVPVDLKNDAWTVRLQVNL